MSEFSIEQTPLQTNQPLSSEVIKNNKVFKSGSGDTVFKIDKYGVFAGGDSFETAPWAVDYQGIQYVGANGEIKLDGPNKKIVVGASDQVVLDGTTGTITTNYLKDATYGLNGVFCSTHTSTNTSGNWSFRIDGPGSSDVPTNGGLLNVTANYVDGTGFYKLLPGYNTATALPYYYVYKLDGYYRIFYYAGNIYTDTTHTTLYFTSFFNSLETSGW